MHGQALVEALHCEAESGVAAIFQDDNEGDLRHIPLSNDVMLCVSLPIYILAIQHQCWDLSVPVPDVTGNDFMPALHELYTFQTADEKEERVPVFQEEYMELSAGAYVLKDHERRLIDKNGRLAH